MSGVFGAGVVTALQEMDIYNKIEAVHATSAGALNGAYFLARQSVLGSSIYYEDLTKDFIKKHNVPFGVAQRFWNRYINKLPREIIRDAVDIDYLLDVVRTRKPLDVRALQSQSIPLYVKLLDVGTGEIEYVDARKSDTMSVLKAGVSVVPYWFSSHAINGKSYIDACVKDPLGLRLLLEHYPDHRIIFSINIPIFRGIRHNVKDTLEGLVAQSMFDIPLFKFFREREAKVRDDIRLAMDTKRVLFLHPPTSNPTMPFTIDPQKLLTTYEMGKNKTEKVMAFLKS